MPGRGYLRTTVLAKGFDRCTVNQELSARDDDLFPGPQTTLNGIIVADGIAESYGTLLGDAAVLSRSGYVDKRLSSDAGYGQDRNRGRRSAAPNDAGLDQLRISKLIQ